MTTLNLEQVLEYNGFKAKVSEIDAKGIAYLLQYGLAQSLQDSVAGYAKKLRDEVTDKGERVYTDEQVADEVTLRMTERFDDILAGEVGARIGGGPRLSGIDKIMRDVAREEIKAAVVKAGMKNPDTKKMAELIESHIAKNGDRLRVEAQARLDKAAASTVDLSALTAAA